MNNIDTTGYLLEGVKPSKAKNVRKTAVKRAVKATDSIKTYSLMWLLVKRTVRFLWTNKVAITVNLFILENAWVVLHHYGLFFK